MNDYLKHPIHLLPTHYLLKISRAKHTQRLFITHMMPIIINLKFVFKICSTMAWRNLNHLLSNWFM